MWSTSNFLMCNLRTMTSCANCEFPRKRLSVAWHQKSMIRHKMLTSTSALLLTSGLWASISGWPDALSDWNPFPSGLLPSDFSACSSAWLCSLLLLWTTLTAQITVDSAPCSLSILLINYFLFKYLSLCTEIYWSPNKENWCSNVLCESFTTVCLSYNKFEINF